jgi:DNA-binding CsgD family transcriptional regulator
MVNRMLKKGMTVVEIAEIMDTTETYVREAIRRFGLPRRDEC